MSYCQTFNVLLLVAFKWASSKSEARVICKFVQSEIPQCRETSPGESQQ